jgi:hypothetical protein
MTYHDRTVKMGESGRVRLNWSGIAVNTITVRGTRFYGVKLGKAVIVTVDFRELPLTEGIISNVVIASQDRETVEVVEGCRDVILDLFFTLAGAD